MTRRPEDRRRAGPKDRASLGRLQLRKLNLGLEVLRKRNHFYRRKLSGVKLPLARLEHLRRIPFTGKEEWVDDQRRHPPFGTNLTAPVSSYVRIHQTSGTTGEPLRWLDTGRSWAWFLDCWREVYRAAEIGPEDVVFAAFGFGPFLGFWGGFDAAPTLGALAVSGGGQSSLQRLQSMRATGTTVLLATPTYALRLAEVAAEHGADLRSIPFRALILAGEPGAHIPSTRARLEESFHSEIFDHSGMTEVGAWGFECRSHAGLHLLETEFLAEVLSKEGTQVGDGEEGELVLTNLGRWDMPAVRYRTGDIVRPRHDPCACGRVFLRFEGGILGRADDMVQVRGVNVYPSAIENAIRAQPEVLEFQVVIGRRGVMREIEVQVEGTPGTEADTLCARVREVIRARLGLTAGVSAVPRGSLPRFELKARRFSIRND